MTQASVRTTTREVHVLEVPLEGVDLRGVLDVYEAWRDALSPAFGQDLHARLGEVPHHARLWWPADVSPGMLGVLAERVSARARHAFLHLWVPTDDAGERPLSVPSHETVIDTYVDGRRVPPSPED